MASILGFILFSEVLTPLQFLGGVLIIGGGVSQIILSLRSAKKPRHINDNNYDDFSKDTVVAGSEWK